MSNASASSGLHKKAAQDHEVAAKHHLKAAEHHDKNNKSDAKLSSKSAMGCCDTALNSSKAACADTAK